MSRDEGRERGKRASRLDALDWPRRFHETHGRSPRVLHLGNVANYAYANARLMRRHGIEAEVVDPDSYHIMATPEWYDAEVRGDWGDDFNPHWARVDLGGYRRPPWFTQGPRDLALERLAARVSGDEGETERLRQAIERAASMRAGILNSGTFVQRIWRRDKFATRLMRAVARRLIYGRRSRSQSGSPMGIPAGAPKQIEALRGIAPLLEAALKPFDIVQGYGLGAMYPLAVSHPNVIAYELGTLRGLPFEDSDTGRLCAWVYRHASAAFVTNIDCLEAARRLGIVEQRTKPMLHAFDTDAAVAYEAAETGDAEIPTGRPFFFAPARHHWVEGSASFRKGNDVIIDATARLAAEGHDFRLVLVAWGEHVEATKARIDAHRMTDRCIWLEPRSRPRLWPIYRSAIGVIDQFSAAALGGVGLEALALGNRLLTRYDEVGGSRFFSAQPPLINCATVDQLLAAMRACVTDPHDMGRFGARGRAWMQAEHSVGRQMGDQFAVYETLIAEGGIACVS